MISEKPQKRNAQDILSKIPTDSAITPEAADMQNINTLLAQWLPDESEIEAIKKRIQDTDTYTYFITKNEGIGKITGIVGMRQLQDDGMKEFTKTNNPIELVNLFTDKNVSGGRTALKLISTLIAQAKEAGYTEILFNSGPRYKDSAWNFYDALLGKRVGILTDFYGKGLDAPVWRYKIEE